MLRRASPSLSAHIARFSISPVILYLIIASRCHLLPSPDQRHSTLEEPTLPTETQRRVNGSRTKLFDAQTRYIIAQK